MPGKVRGYADTVVAALGRDTDPALADLLAAADAVDAAFSAPATRRSVRARRNRPRTQGMALRRTQPSSRRYEDLRRRPPRRDGSGGEKVRMADNP